MRLLIKQEPLSLTDRYSVYDGTEETRYAVGDEFLSFGHRIHVFDMRSGREVGSIHQRLFSFFPEFEIVIDGCVQGTIRKKSSFLTPRHHVDYRGWDVEGNLMGWDYRVMRGNSTVMTISKAFFNWMDTYVLNYSNPCQRDTGPSAGHRI